MTHVIPPLDPPLIRTNSCKAIASHELSEAKLSENELIRIKKKSYPCLVAREDRVRQCKCRTFLMFDLISPATQGNATQSCIMSFSKAEKFFEYLFIQMISPLQHADCPLTMVAFGEHRNCTSRLRHFSAAICHKVSRKFCVFVTSASELSSKWRSTKICMEASLKSKFKNSTPVRRLMGDERAGANRCA